MRRGTRTITAVVTLAVGLTTGVGSAAATADPTGSTRLALQVAGVSAGAPGVALPDRGSSVRVGDLSIRYPLASQRSRSVDRHTKVFEGRHFDQVVQSTGQDDVRLLTVLTDRSAPTTYDYAFDGQQLRALDEGYVGVFDAETGQPVALIEPAWAKDANGNAVGTRYEVDGSTLTQVVDITADTAFPVVADPTVKRHWWGQELRLNKSETMRLAAGGGSCSWIPYIGVACRVLAVWASSALALHKCLAVKQVWGAPAIPWYWSCRW